jgi:anti-anti-sigma factor
MGEAPSVGVTVGREDGVWLVTLTGEFDLANVGELRTTLEALLAPEHVPLSRPRLVVLDLSAVTFMDSTTIQAIFLAHELAARDPDTQLTVVIDSPESFPARLLCLVGMTRCVPTYDSKEMAEASMREPLGA